LAIIGFERRLADRRSRSDDMKWREMLLLLAGLLLLIGALFWELTRVIKNDIRRFYYTQVQRHAQRAAEAIQRDTPQAFRDDATSRSLEQWVAAGLEELVRAQQSVKAVMIVDRQGRVRLLKTAPDSGLENSMPNPSLALWTRADDVLAALRAANPAIEVSHFTLSDRQRPYGRLDVLYDTTPPQEMILRAARYSAGELALALLAVGGVTWIFVLQQRATRRLREQRDRSDQLAYVGALAAGLAHEIRNPLNALAMQLEMLEEDAEKPGGPRPAERIQRIRSGLQGVELAVGEFLNYAAPGQQKPAMVDLADRLGAICREFSADEARGLVECRVPQGLSAWCDVNALRQVMGNLLSNGWRAQEACDARERRLRVDASREGDWVVIGVEDAGPGVPDALRDQVFECFFSTSGDGSGLGLPIARRLAEMNGGALELAPQGGALGGARFLLRLPSRPPAKRRAS
jgi:signal transduction histidine kinase